ncbi:zinc finger protein 512B isoform X2 [Amia ocellicauda]|uniref:zinc finger protein 512B isoform X2 n=1 Tax=Amia ocellicauda TaxID=2972642 RepID=UPI003463937B
MADSSKSRPGSTPSGVIKARSTKQSGLTEAAKKLGTEDNKLGTSANEKVEVKKKGRPRAENQELRSIPATIAEKLSHQCPYCEAVFASKIRLQKHKAWNHAEKVSQEQKVDNKVQKATVKGNAKKRAAENSGATPVMSKVKKMQEVSQLSQNGECVAQKADKKHTQGTSSEESPKTPGGSESETGSLPPPFPEEDPERTRHRRKQKTPKKFTGEQPSISGTFGMKGLNKSEEKMKSGRGKKSDGNVFNEEAIRKLQSSALRKESGAFSPGSPEAQWQHAITERGEVVCPTCSLVTRKTVLGLKKHMEICQKLQDALKCQHCQKQFKSKAGLNYHTMAEHSNKPIVNEGLVQDGQEERERLRRVLKQMGKLKCPNEGCTATFSSLMGYQYHQRRCGKEPSDLEKPMFKCSHCGKTYKSKAGHDYHVRCEHTAINATPTPVETLQEVQEEDHPMQEEEAVEDFERTPSGRVRRRSAQVAVFHLQEIAEDELAKDWSKRRMKDDLVPDSKRLNYTRPGLPIFNPKMLESWKNEVKDKGFICCPNSGCEAVYSSVSGLKAHLANCNKGSGAVGKYRCLLCQKEFNSESGVKYHISKTHSQNWFRASHTVAPNSKRKEQRNGLKKDLKNSTTGKKRGRKPKERLPEAPQRPVEVPQSKTSTASSSDSSPSPAANRTNPVQQRDTKTPTKKRGKPRKVPSN